MILLLNGAFGVGKTTVARALSSRLPGSTVYDPELLGIAMQRLARLAGRRVDDFQDLALWRRSTVLALRVARRFRRTVIVPMAFSERRYLEEIRSALQHFEPRVHHVCLVAPLEVVHARLRGRGADPRTNAWEFRRAAECCAAHASDAFGLHIDAAEREPDQIADAIVRAIESDAAGARR